MNRTAYWIVPLACCLSSILAAPLVAQVGALRGVSVGGLSFGERLECQSAIERVYWRNRVWPQENTAAKPSFESAMPFHSIRAKTEDALLKSNALEELWQRPLTAEMLQAELDRMAQNTKRPATLRQIFAALDNDPKLLGECLARPVLADRLLREWYANDERLHEEARALAAQDLEQFGEAETLRFVSGSYREIEIDPDGRIGQSPISDSDRGEAHRVWRKAHEWLGGIYGGAAAGSTPRRSEAPPQVRGLPERQVSILQESRDRFYAVAVLEQRDDVLEIAIAEWAKIPFEHWWEEQRENLGAPAAVEPFEYELRAPEGVACEEDTWRPTLAPIVDSNWGTAVWTGSEMLVWGGFPFREDRANYGGRYDPATDSWGLIGTWNAAANRGRHTAIWTGTEMIVWGGESDGFQLTDTGGRYDPATNTWTTTTTVNAPAPRFYQTSVWTGEEMIVWGGCTSSLCSALAATGGRYNPISDSWSAVATSSAPDGRYLHSAIWTGAEMIVWGGWTGSAVENTGGRYDPTTDSWSATDTSAAPAARFFHSAVWTGDGMIVWGGREGEFSTVYFATGGRYEPLTDSWTATSMTDAPSARDGHRAVWTGAEMILFGGYDGSTDVNTGGRYDPLLDSWAATATLNAPSPRSIPTMVWTGNEMIAWAGWGSGPGLADGGRYSPASDSWVPVGSPQTPSERDFHTHTWTGTEVVVWGGCGIFAVDPCPTDTGGFYDLVTDTWSPTSVVGAPIRREFHNAVWTGTEMLVWGGCGDVYCNQRFDTGGRFDPATNSWLSMSDVDAPVRRYWHDGVWTGTEMIVWGGCGNMHCTNTVPPLPRDGGRYDPATDSWTPTTLTGAPGGRWFATTTWTGTEMIVWGGQDMDVGMLDNGARYDPATDSWVLTSTTGAPIPRIRHRSHWTGDRLLVWGGDDYAGNFYDVGGSYDPATDAWTATTQVDAPSARSYPYTAWTGQELVVWGGLPANDAGGRYDPVADSWRPMTLVEAPTVRADSSNGAWTGNEMVVFGGGYPDTLMETETGGVYCAAGTAGPGIFGDGLETGDTSAWSLVVE